MIEELKSCNGNGMGWVEGFGLLKRGENPLFKDPELIERGLEKCFTTSKKQVRMGLCV